eukprot:IDg2307t1
MVYLRPPNPYRAGEKKREFSRGQINRMLEEGVIEPCNSELVSSVVLAPKKDEGLQFSSTTED